MSYIALGLGHWIGRSLFWGSGSCAYIAKVSLRLSVLHDHFGIVKPPDMQLVYSNATAFSSSAHGQRISAEMYHLSLPRLLEIRSGQTI